MPVRTITPTEVQAVIASGVPVDLIDVRTALEFKAVHAVGARHVPLAGLDPAAVMASRRAPADQPVYIICATNSRSAMAAQAFIDAGFANVFSVAGGTGAWSAAGLPVERSAGGMLLTIARQAAIYAVVAVGVMTLMPCSPWSVWGSAWCPTAPAAESAPATPAASVDFDRDVVAASRQTPVLVDFHATWCGPCRMLAPEIEAVAQARGKALQVVKIDVDANPAIAQAQGIAGIPDLRLWHGGREIARSVGFRPRAQLETWIDTALAGGK